MKNMDQESKYLHAKERIAEIRKFYNGLMSYIVVISLLAGLNYYIDEWNHPWFLWAAFGWGIGLAFQAARAFVINPFFGRDWEERKINEFMQEDERKSRWE